MSGSGTAEGVVGLVLLGATAIVGFSGSTVFATGGATGGAIPPGIVTPPLSVTFGAAGLVTGGGFCGVVLIVPPAFGDGGGGVGGVFLATCVVSGPGPAGFATSGPGTGAGAGVPNKIQSPTASATTAAPPIAINGAYLLMKLGCGATGVGTATSGTTAACLLLGTDPDGPLLGTDLDGVRTGSGAIGPVLSTSSRAMSPASS